MKPVTGPFKILATLTMASLSSFGQMHAAEEGELINKNGGFEEGKGFYHLVHPENCAIDSDEVYRGQFSMRINAIGDKDEALADPMVVAGYTIPETADNTEYVFRCAVKTQNVDPANPPKIQLVINQPAPDGKNMNVTIPESDQLVFDRDMDWTPYEVKISGLPTDTQTLGFWIRTPKQTQTTLWVDEIEIREVKK